MPHCILEHSDNIVDQVDFTHLLLDVNELLAGTGLFKLDDIKSRAICHNLYVIGDGAPDRTFVTINICILSGREEVVKIELSNTVLKLLERLFPRTLAETRCSLTVRITDMHRNSYAKTTSYET